TSVRLLTMNYNSTTKIPLAKVTHLPNLSNKDDNLKKDGKENLPLPKKRGSVGDIGDIGPRIRHSIFYRPSQFFPSDSEASGETSINTPHLKGKKPIKSLKEKIKPNYLLNEPEEKSVTELSDHDIEIDNDDQDSSAGDSDSTMDDWDRESNTSLNSITRKSSYKKSVVNTENRIKQNIAGDSTPGKSSSIRKRLPNIQENSIQAARNSRTKNKSAPKRDIKSIFAVSTPVFHFFRPKRKKKKKKRANIIYDKDVGYYKEKAEVMNLFEKIDDSLVSKEQLFNGLVGPKDIRKKSVKVKDVVSIEQPKKINDQEIIYEPEIFKRAKSTKLIHVNTLVATPKLILPKVKERFAVSIHGPIRSRKLKDIDSKTDSWWTKDQYEDMRDRAIKRRLKMAQSTLDYQHHLKDMFHTNLIYRPNHVEIPQHSTKYNSKFSNDKVDRDWITRPQTTPSHKPLPSLENSLFTNSNIFENARTSGEKWQSKEPIILPIINYKETTKRSETPYSVASVEYQSGKRQVRIHQ
ncbi:hypothetical protein HDV02_002957, partial [Globomyces sp. JEL0801]